MLGSRQCIPTGRSREQGEERIETTGEAWLAAVAWDGIFQAMDITVTIPDAIGASLRAGGGDIQRAILEGFAVESYRTGTLSAAEVRVLLGHASRWETEDFLSAHDAWPGTTAEQVAEDGRTLDALLNR